MNSLVIYFRNIIIFLIFMNFVSMLLPNKSYKNYVDFIMGLILISIVISPIFKIIKTNNTPDFESAIITKNSDQTYYTNNEENNYALTLYQNQVSSQIKTLVEKSFNVSLTNIVVEIDENDLSLIKSISLNISTNSIDIEPINISLNTAKKDIVENEDIKSIKNLISSAYNLSVDNIHISTGN